MTGDDRLQQYFDGELGSADAHAIERELESDAELRAKLEGLAHLRTLLVSAAEEQGDQLDSGAMWAAIEGRLGGTAEGDDPMFPVEEVSEPGRALGVIRGGKAPETKARTEPKPQTEPKPRRNVVWIGVAATLAIAAAVLLVVMKPFDFAASGGGQQIAEAPPPGTEVEEVDFGYNTGAVFSVEGQEGERYAVVWISDEKPVLDENGQERLQ